MQPFTIFIDAHPYKDNFNYCCGTPGQSPGWKNSFHRLTYANADLSEATSKDITTDSDCCKECVKDPKCIGWVYTNKVCLLGVNKELLPDICTYPTLSETNSSLLEKAPWEASGVIRCSDGCNLPQTESSSLAFS
ncbi:5553_t:CDS:2 [Cetraspora pellucida]|uniref:5553_t:CDS:1 n=1 Tax=Cetraspora pellucida TaxID=1433469 RepID=A0A9N9AEJ3_9GLOM|nr:5553_t:CDS:2 [Cetraspora pellucida]